MSNANDATEQGIEGYFGKCGENMKQVPKVSRTGKALLKVLKLPLNFQKMFRVPVITCPVEIKRRW